MQTLEHQRCFNHFLREAVARCPACRQCFCRECITEHEDRIICASCLKKIKRSERAGNSILLQMFRIAQCGIGLLIAWFFFYLIGAGLLKLPDSFHQETLWHILWADQE